uniref:FMN hydroxy acid dehydrogenase domain-containing protein n=1 Tax=Bionectria ochroleuca TaxID=29856 RepID=A0A8H7NHU7_BIOOC
MPSKVIRPRVLKDVAQIDLSTRILGSSTQLPIGLAPSAMQKLAGGDGEVDTATAAATMGLNMTLSSQSTSSLEDVANIRNKVNSAVASESTPPFWMQLYLYEDSKKSVSLIQRAEGLGLDGGHTCPRKPTVGEKDSRRAPPSMSLPNLQHSTDPTAKPQPSVNRRMMNARTAAEAREILDASGSTMHSSSLTWESTIPFLRSVTKMKIILKGIMTPEDAALAVEHGVDGIIVSNHGGRQLDAAASTIEALLGIVAVVNKRIPIILDGGIRTGTDVFKALALGADFVMIGRPVLWGLAYGGVEGVQEVVNILERELSRTMALAGIGDLKELSKDALGVITKDSFGIVKL